MKKGQLFLFAALLVAPITCAACSMYKITQKGITIVGNNEDWISPNSKFWFESAQSGQYGVMYMGQLNNFVQGAFNEAGLVFDGFWEPSMPLKNTGGKLKIPIGDALKKVMQTMSRVEEVQSYLQTINLSSLTNGQLVFVDNSGTYLIVEGDEMFVNRESEKTFSNFYYSQTKTIEDVALDYFQSGQAFLKNTEKKSTIGYCSEAMKAFSQANISPTQYTTIYNLNTLKIRVYLFHDYTQYIELDLREELRKGNHTTMIAELFSKESVGYKHYEMYNNPEHPTLLLEEFLKDKGVSEQLIMEVGFNNIIEGIGNEWLNDKKNPKGAIKVFQYGVKLMPNNATAYENLGAAYFANKDWDNATVNYAKSLSLNPGNETAIEMISKIAQFKKQ